MEDNFSIITRHENIPTTNTENIKRKSVTFDELPTRRSSLTGKKEFNTDKCRKSTYILYKPIDEENCLEILDGFVQTTSDEILIIPSQYWISKTERNENRKKYKRDQMRDWIEKTRSENQIPTKTKCEEFFNQKVEQIKKQKSNTLACVNARNESLLSVKSTYVEKQNYINEHLL